VIIGGGRLEMHVLDVGQGDAVALRTPRGRWVIVDAGRRWSGGDAGRRVVVPYVRRFGGEVAAFVLSHAHDDHVGGAASVVRALSPQRWWEPAFVTTSEAYRNALDEVRRAGVAWHRVRPGDRWELDDVEFRVLAPDSAWTDAQEDANETSVVMRVAYGGVSFLLTGDAEGAEERWLLEHTDPALLRADVLKLGHHGSKTSSSLSFVSVVDPRIGVASVGAGNRYGHPSPETLETFTTRGVPVLRTDLEGTVVISTNGERLEVRVGRERWDVPER
jgi:competence protein ComEC